MSTYSERRCKDGTIMRVFESSVDPDALVWHTDEHDRVVEVVHGSGWSLQLDNELPVVMTEGNNYYVKAGDWHRLHKGAGNLIVRITEMKEKSYITKSQLLELIREAKDQNDDNKNDFEDVKIARMLASGMTKEEIKKKHPELFKEYKDKKGVPKQYQAHKKGRRSHFNQLEKLNKQIKQAEKDGNTSKAESLKKKRIKLRDEEEAEQRKKNEALLREYVHQALLEKKKKKKKCKLSKSTEKKVKKVADKKGYTFGSLKGEYCKGLGAFYSSGSRPGMTAHGWAMARVNKATPSKSWANVKKSKAKKK